MSGGCELVGCVGDVAKVGSKIGLQNPMRDPNVGVFDGDSFAGGDALDGLGDRRVVSPDDKRDLGIRPAFGAQLTGRLDPHAGKRAHACFSRVSRASMASLRA